MPNLSEAGSQKLLLRSRLLQAKLGKLSPLGSVHLVLLIETEILTLIRIQATHKTAHKSQTGKHLVLVKSAHFFDLVV
jgi:DNA-binding IclR family transcriptional regulator